MRLRVAPHSASSGFAGDRVSSCLASRPSAHSVAKFRLPRSSLLRLRLPMRPPGCPGFCIFRPCRRWIFESPRISHPSTHPAHKPWVAPKLRFRLCLPMHSPSRPGSCIFRLCRRRIFELPRVSRPSAPLMLMLWVSPQHCSFSHASRCSCGLPRLLHLPALPWAQVFESPRKLFPLGAG